MKFLPVCRYFITLTDSLGLRTQKLFTHGCDLLEKGYSVCIYMHIYTNIWLYPTYDRDTYQEVCC
jgi:hypothetical protein